jgi:hypothetical protein
MPWRLERPAESLDASRLIARTDQHHAQAAPGLGVGRVDLHRLAEGDGGFVHLPAVCGFHAGTHQDRHALTDGRR